MIMIHDDEYDHNHDFNYCYKYDPTLTIETIASNKAKNYAWCLVV